MVGRTLLLFDVDGTLTKSRKVHTCLHVAYFLTALQRISEEMDRQKIANIAVLQPGLVPSTPVRPRKRLNLAVGTMEVAGG